MPEVFMTELRQQRDMAREALEQALVDGDDFGAHVWERRLAELAALAARNGVADAVAQP